MASFCPPAGFLDPEWPTASQLVPLAEGQPPLSSFQEQQVGLEAEKEELGRQVQHLQLERRDLLQVKASLSLEVVTYR